MENWTLDDWLNDLDNCVKRGLYFEISGHSAGLLRDQIKKAAGEIERLQKQIRYQEHRDGRIRTHDPICYGYGPSHYECALRKIDMLQEALQFYASKNNYEKKKVWTTTFPQYEPDGYKIVTPVLSDNGEKARAALKEGE